MAETSTSPKRLVWRLCILMVEREIRTAAELKRRLQEIGHEITRAHAARIVARMPQRISTDLLAALLTVLDCSAADLLMAAPEPQEETAGRSRQPEVPEPGALRDKGAPGAAKSGRERAVAGEQLAVLVGPRVTAFPKPFGE